MALQLNAHAARLGAAERGRWANLKWLLTAAIFALCVAPTFISYGPYQFRWDDSDYMQRAIAANRAFWSGDVHGLGAAMVGWHTPVMTLMNLPWARSASRDAVGQSFVMLAGVTALCAALCLYLLLRVGVKPILLAIASACVGASLGPYQAGEHARYMHDLATAFLSDGLLAWLALAAVLLVPYEATIPCPSGKSALARGVLCASIFSLGALTKVSFCYFIVLTLPLVLFISLRRDGVRIVRAWLAGFFCIAVPTGLYFLRYGRSAFATAGSASFGKLGAIYHVSLLRFLDDNILESPGLVLSIALFAAAVVYVISKRRPNPFRPDCIALWIMVGFVLITLAAPARLIRYLFPGIVALPFLVSIVMSDREDSLSASRAGLVSGLVLVVLLTAAVPMRNRPYEWSLAPAEAVLAQANRCGAKNVLLATDSATLNPFLLNLAAELSSSKIPIDTLAFHAISSVPIQDDFVAMSKSDMVAFQDATRLRLNFTNVRVVEYRQYMQRSSSDPIRVGDDTTLYSKACN